MSKNRESNQPDDGGTAEDRRTTISLWQSLKEKVQAIADREHRKIEGQLAAWVEADEEEQANA